ncbi:MAG: hypothetical protein KIT09_25830 [Bryobacteraceae bacterium]|nr:hypothetical protein [Bryobacteraceae bacterium]
MTTQRLVGAVRSSPFWKSGSSLTDVCANGHEFGRGVDLAWYLRKYRRLPQPPSLLEGIEHYGANAADAFLSPNLAFDEAWYRHSHPDVDASVRAGAYRSGWEHYLAEGASRQYSPALWFDERWYQRRCHEAWTAVKSGALLCGFEHYLLYGIHQDLQPSLYFNPRWYRRQYLGSGDGPGRAYPVVDYALCEDKAARCPAPFFDETWYRARYLNASLNGDARYASGFEHYMYRGRKRGYSPSPRFNEMAYRELNPDVLGDIEQGRYASGFEHYVEEGILEGRAVPTHYELGGVDYAGPEFLRSYERSLRLNFQQFRRLKELVEQTP